ncbi:MAG: choice-of-anchor D domain-containing protein [Bacteroidales bacterium]|nr:choice-of-anchor D domain-containing protein [Bacteroidales bacterium]
MKKFFLLSMLALMAYASFAQGWRKDEMEVKVFIQNEIEYQALYELKLNGDMYPGYAQLYVTPAELLKLQSAGLKYEVTIEDLNAHYKDFWLTEDAYHTYPEIINIIDSLALHFSDICQKHSYGTSYQGRQLAALKISDNVNVDENEPEIFFDGGIHGDEIGCSENMIRFARELCLEYGNNATITNLINSREIWLYIMVNPDGRVNMSRYNANGVDCNRDAGYMWDQWGGSPGPFSQNESKGVRECNYNNQFVIYTAYHSGTEIISYPWSYRPDPTPDNTHINFLAALYSSSSGYSNLAYAQGYSGMYAINGSTKDSYYGIMGSVSWSMEISMSKQPPASQIMMYYNYNKPAMLKMIEYAGYGIGGTVTDASTGQPVAALVFVGNSYPSYSDPVVGDYHKFLVPGTYTLTVKANGYQTQTVTGVTVTSMNSTVTNFQLQPLAGHYAYKFASSQIPDNNHSDEGNTKAALMAPDNVNYSIGKNGWCVLDMQYPILDTQGNDLIVYEGDATPEGYTCYASDNIDGPWVSLGTGSGTTEFDLLDGNLPQAQFIKIVDDGDGTAVVADAGFDLDAVKAFEPVPGPYLFIQETLVDDAIGGNGNGRLDPGETADLIITVKNNGNQAALNTSGGLNTTSPYINIIDPTADFGSIQPGMTGTGTYTISVDPATPIGHVAYMTQDISANSGGYTVLFEQYFTVGLVVENFETGNFSAYPWQFSGNLPWTITTTAPYEGTYCSRSGAIGNSQSSSMFLVINVASAGNISFARKVSSETGYDFLKFYIDGSMMDQWSGNVAWGEVSFPLSQGNHTLKWEYVKDANTIGGSDCAWVDYIIFPPLSPPAPAIAVTPVSLDFGQVFIGDNLTKPLTISNNGSMALSGSITTPAGYAVALADNTLAFNVQPGQSTVFNITFSPLAAQTYSGNITITHNAPGGTTVVPVTGMGITGFVLPYTQNFDNAGSMPYSWVNATGDDFDWSVNSGSTPSSGTGPTGDHTTGSGYYMFTESSSPNYPSRTANLETPLFDLSGMTTVEMKFWYHMYGTAMGSLHLDAFAGGVWVNDIMTAISGNQGNAWYEKTLDLTSYAGQSVKFRFRGITGTNYTSDMAIDDFWMGGTSGTPQIVVSPGLLAVSLPPDGTQNETVSLDNPGTGLLSYSTTISYLSGANGWLSITSNPAGNVSAGGSIDMNVHFDATGLFPGLNTAEILINSNDPVNPVVVLPVSLTVSGAVILDLKVFLEGPFVLSQMNPYLNNLNYLPLCQPFNVEPWNYFGTEAVASIPSSNVIDWVLVELRETTGTASTAVADSIIARQAGFVLNNGKVVGLDGASNLFFSLEPTADLYVVIRHRNHLGVMSSIPLQLSGGVYLYDFTTGAGQAYGGYNGHKEVGAGIWGMVGGDGLCDGQINAADKIAVWLPESGQSGYKAGDFDLNGQVSNQDKVDVWGSNAGKGCQVP